MENQERVKVAKLENDEDWHQWKFLIRIILQSSDLIGFVNGTAATPLEVQFQSQDEYLKAVEKFQQKEFSAQRVIVTALGKKPILHVMNCATAADMWNKLHSVYEQKSKVTIHLIHEKFFNFKMESGDSVAEHSSKLQSIVKQLKDLGESVSDEMVITKLLMSLPNQFRYFHSAWDSTAASEQTYENLVARLTMEEKRMEKEEKKSHHDNADTSEALVAKKFQRRTFTGNKSVGNSKSGRCFHCDETGHWKRDCPKRSQQNNGSSSNTSFSNGFSGNFCSCEENKGKQETARKGGALIAVSEKSDSVKRREAFLTLKEAMSSQKGKSGRSIDWYLDSGASDHMTFYKGWFVDYEPFDEHVKVRIGNGSYIYAEGQGSINVLSYNGSMWCERHLLAVLYVPEIHLNLFSQNTVLDKGLTLCADSSKCEFRENERVAAIGIRDGNLFKLMFKVDTRVRVESFSAGKETVLHQSSRRCGTKATISTGGNASRRTVSLSVWHERLGHQNIQQVRKFLRESGTQYQEETDFFCESCLMGKHHRSSFKRSESRAAETGELVHADVCGPMPQKSIGGSRYFVLFKDDFSSYRMVYFLTQKSQVSDCIKKYISSIKSVNSTISVFRSDNGLEFVNESVTEIFSINGITHQRTVPYTPEQNGRAEREIRTIVESTRSMIHSKNMALGFWAEAVNTAIYVLNRTGPSPVSGKSPYELWFKRKPKIDHLRIFGSDCYVHIPKQKRKKLDKKAKKGIFVGYCDNVKGYRVWIPDEKSIEISRDVLFRENCGQIGNPSEPSTYESSEVEFILSDSDGDEVESQTFENRFGSDDIGGGVNEHDISIEGSTDGVVEKVPANDADHEENATNGNVSIDDDIIFENVSPLKHLRLRMPMPMKQTTQKLKKSVKTNVKKESYLCDIDLGYAFVAGGEPASLNEALQSNESAKWKDAMDSEFESLKKNQTWKLVKLPQDRKVIDNKWVFKLKQRPNGQIERYKARLVVRGFTQEYGIDYEETFSPVVKFTSLRTILAMAAAEGMYMKQFDVATAFLYGDLDDEIYMRQPRGYEDGTDRVCKLQKSLYGLKQASRVWNAKFTKFLTDFQLKATLSDPCVFVVKKDYSKIVLGIFIDDGMVAATHEEDITHLIDHLTHDFEIKVSDCEYFVGLEIDRREDGSFHVCQQAYTKKVLEKFRMMDSHCVSTPAEANIIEEPTDDISRYPFREAVGSLMYLAIGTRPDIAFAVGRVSRRVNNPSETDVNDVKRILRYLRGTVDLGILYESNAKFSLNCYSDSDYAGDRATRRSTTGFVVMLGSGAISWSSHLQKCVALSTTEAEYVSSSQAVKELVWLNFLLDELFVKYQSKTLFVDNLSAIRLIKNPEFHKRTKHIDVMYHFVREKFREGFFVLNYIPTNEQVADILTKPLTREKFLKFRMLMGVN